jgi:tetratricopeptide (TPR) repeat protein
MTKKNLLAVAGMALGCGLGAWFIGRHVISHDGWEAIAKQTSSTGPSPMLKPLTKEMSQKQAPATPAHEKAFLEEQLKTKPGHPPILLRLAELEKNEGKLADAKKHLEEAIKSDPSLIDARLELSLVSYQLGDADEAEKQNLAVLKLDARQPDALYNMGAICANKNRLVEARQYWTDAVKYGADTESGKNAASALTKIR